MPKIVILNPIVLLVPWDFFSSYRPQLYKAQCSVISPVASEPCQQQDLSMELLPSASPAKLQPLKDRLQDRILNSRRELQDKICNFSPLKEDRLGIRKTIMMNFSPNKGRHVGAKTPIKNALFENDCQDTFVRTPFRSSFKDAFGKDIATIKDALSKSQQAISSIASPRNMKRKQSNLINEDRSCDFVDMSVDMCPKIQGDNYKEEENETEEEFENMHDENLAKKEKNTGKFNHK